MNIYLITKLIAFITMLIDHIGSIASINIFRAIGRISFPLFCLLMGYSAKNSNSLLKKTIKLLVYGLISVPICKMYFGSNSLNILLGFCIFTFTIWLCKKINANTFMEIFLIITVSMLTFIYNFEYTFLLPLLCYVFYKCNNKYISVSLFALLELFYTFYRTNFTGLNFINNYALCAIPFMLLFYYMIDYYKKHDIKLERHVYKARIMNILASNLFYILYPLHLIIVYYIYNYC